MTWAKISTEWAWIVNHFFSFVEMIFLVFQEAMLGTREPARVSSMLGAAQVSLWRVVTFLSSWGTPVDSWRLSSNSTLGYSALWLWTVHKALSLSGHLIVNCVPGFADRWNWTWMTGPIIVPGVTCCQDFGFRRKSRNWTFPTCFGFLDKLENLNILGIAEQIFPIHRRHQIESGSNFRLSLVEEIRLFQMIASSVPSCPILGKLAPPCIVFPNASFGRDTNISLFQSPNSSLQE